MRSPGRFKRVGLAFAMYVVPVLVAGGLVAFFSLRAYGVLPRLGVAPGYALTASTGETTSSEDMRGKIVVYTFGSTLPGGARHSRQRTESRR